MAAAGLCVGQTRVVGEFRAADLGPNTTLADYLRREDALFADMVWQGMAKRYPDGYDEQRRKQAEYEIQIICQMGFPAYFLVVADFINWAKDNGVAVGPGRGSAAGSIVAYAMGITDLDPLDHGLIFERFLNPERISMPDIDIDFCQARRGEVIEYVTRKYGRENVAQIVTFSQLKPKAAVRDVTRVLDTVAATAMEVMAAAWAPAAFRRSTRRAKISACRPGSLLARLRDISRTSAWAKVSSSGMPDAACRSIRPR